jgi:hypothetical protein
MPLRLTRRQVLQAAALLVTTAGVPLLAACAPQSQPTTDATPKGAPPSTPAQTAALAATATPTARPVPSRPSIIKSWPDGPSTVVHARHAAVWKEDRLDPVVVRQMLDASIVALTGQGDARSAWAAIFRPTERIAIKVNTIRNGLYWTHPPLVKAVTDSLLEAGIPGEQILVYDRATDELKGAGYALNVEGPGVRCAATDGDYVSGWQVAGRDVRLSKRLLECDALINMPVLKSHSLSGITFALKNHYGTFDRPEAFHEYTSLVKAISELNALPPIRERARLVVGDALTACLKEALDWPYWRTSVQGNSVFMGYDPVAVDTIALEEWSRLVTADGGAPKMANTLAGGWLAAAAKLGVGTNDGQNIKLAAVTLG